MTTTFASEAQQFLHIHRLSTGCDQGRSPTLVEALLPFNSEAGVVRRLFSLLAQSSGTPHHPGAHPLVDVIFGLGNWYAHHRQEIIEAAIGFDYRAAPRDAFRLPCLILLHWKPNNELLFQAVRAGFGHHTDIAKRWKPADGQRLRCCCGENNSTNGWNHYGDLCPAYCAATALLHANPLRALEILRMELEKSGDFALDHHVWERICAALKDYYLIGKSPRIQNVDGPERQSLDALIPGLIRDDRLRRTSIREPEFPLAVAGVFGQAAIPRLLEFFEVSGPREGGGRDCYDSVVRCLEGIGGAAQLIVMYGEGQNRRGIAPTEMQLLVLFAIKRIIGLHSLGSSDWTECCIGDDGSVTLIWLLGLLAQHSTKPDERLFDETVQCIRALLTCKDKRRIQLALRYRAVTELLKLCHSGKYLTAELGDIVGCFPDHLRNDLRPLISARGAEDVRHLALVRAVEANGRIPIDGVRHAVTQFETQLTGQSDPDSVALVTAIRELTSQTAALAITNDGIEALLK